MATILNLILDFIALVIIAEIAARIYFKRHYGIPFRSRKIGEYPYNRFIEMVEPPQHYCFLKGFRSKYVNINRFGCRSPEPAPTGAKKRLLVIGESNIFGVKLNHESELWNARLTALLKRHGYHDWEVINAGTPLYSSTQHRLYWEKELDRVKPDIVLIGFGFNDLSQAWMMGAKWNPDSIWPTKFVLALERKTPTIQRFLSHFCLYLLWRRSASNRREFQRLDENFRWHDCVETVAENFSRIAEISRARGARVATFAAGLSYDRKPTPDDARKLEAIQTNWRSFLSGRGAYDLELIDEVKKISRKLKLPCIDLDETLRRNPRRYELYLDIAHFNDAGMRVIARTFFQEILALGWWDKEKKQKKGEGKS